MRFSLAGAVLVLLVTLELTTARSLDACTLIGGYGVRRPELTPLVARAGAQTVSARRGVPPDLARLRAERGLEEVIFAPGRLWWWRASWARFLDTFRPPLPYGQLVRVERVGGRDSLRLVAALAHSGGEAVLVDWQLTGSCATALSRSRRPWIVPGQRVFLAVTLRPRSGWVGARPTFDALPFDGGPYFEPEYRARFGSPAFPLLTVEQMWGLYQVLPDLDALRQDTAAALAPLRAWQQAHPTLAAHWPVRVEVGRANNCARQEADPAQRGTYLC